MSRQVTVEAQVIDNTEDAIRLATKLLWEFGVPSKVWQRGDFEQEWQDQTGNDTDVDMPDDAWEQIQNTYGHKHLADCTETDWMLVEDAVKDSLDSPDPTVGKTFNSDTGLWT